MKSPTRVFIIHGWGGHPRIHWLGWLADELKTLGYQTIAPALPSPDHPNMADWLTTLRTSVGVSIASDIYIGHSLGAITILKFWKRLRFLRRERFLSRGLPPALGLKKQKAFLRLQSISKTLEGNLNMSL